MLLRHITIEDELQVKEAHDIMDLENFNFLFNFKQSMSFKDYIANMNILQPGWVPSTFFVGVVDNNIIGRISIRHSLTPELTLSGGHIGYCVLPKYRGCGHAKEMLSQSLKHARTLDMPSVILTCSKDNVASQRVINNFGAIELEPFGDTLRYCIKL